MAENTLEADGSTPWLTVRSEGAHMSLQGDFGGGTVTVEQRIKGATYDLLDSGTAITSAVAVDQQLNVRPGDTLRFTLAGATAPSLDWKLAGAGMER